MKNARNTRKEPKNLRFDVLECLSDPNRFFLYEVYLDKTGLDDHKTTTHYQNWRDSVEELNQKEFFLPLASQLHNYYTVVICQRKNLNRKLIENVNRAYSGEALITQTKKCFYV